MGVTRKCMVLVLTVLCSSAAMAALSVYMPHEVVADRASLVVEGVVAGVASGLDPDSNTLATYITLDVATVHRGPSGLQKVTLREPGGTFGSLSNVLDAVPVYSVGEKVVAFLEPTPDGALRTAGMFFGKYTLSEDRNTASRDLDGRGLILGHSTPETEAVPTADLESLTAARRPMLRRTRRVDVKAWTAEPPEMDRIVWDGDAGSSGMLHSADSGTAIVGLAPDIADPQNSRFVTLSSSSPARWYGVDDGIALTVDGRDLLPRYQRHPVRRPVQRHQQSQRLLRRPGHRRVLAQRIHW
jgi:hypothetical protein